MSKLYSSLRVVHPVDRVRSGALPNLVTAAGNRTIEFRAEPYDHFVVLPDNVEIPMQNVSSAIPAGSAAGKTRMVTGRKKKPAEVNGG